MTFLSREHFKSVLRNTLARVLSMTGLIAPTRIANGKLTIVTFHRVLPEQLRNEYPFPGLAVTPEELDWFLDYFKQHFDCGTLALQHERFLGGEKSGRPLLAITFDDAQHDNYLYAYPILEKHGLKASFFVPVEAVETGKLLWHDRLGFSIQLLKERGSRGVETLMTVLAQAGIHCTDERFPVSWITQQAKNMNLADRLQLVEKIASAADLKSGPEYARMMSLHEIAELANSGHEIGSHSMTHCMMTECDDYSLSYEVGESKKRLQHILGKPVESFCYPNGNCDLRTAQAVAGAGYRRGISTAWGNNQEVDDRYRMRRFDIVAKHIMDNEGRLIPSLLEYRMSGYFPGLGFR
jgi:peptidoglycan/xylan/chitin deacetylase (PgdA/CDA1 family)